MILNEEVAEMQSKAQKVLAELKLKEQSTPMLKVKVSRNTVFLVPAHKATEECVEQLKSKYRV